MRRKKPVWKTVSSVFLSMDFAILLLIAIGIYSAAGSLIAQDQSPAYYFEQFGGFWGGLFIKLGLTSFYRSPYFICLFLLLTLSLSFCIAHRIYRMIYRFHHIGTKGLHSQKYYLLSSLSFLLIHSAFLSVALGVAIDTNLISDLSSHFADSHYGAEDPNWIYQHSFRGHISLYPQTSTTSFYKRDENSLKIQPLPFKIRLNQFSVRYDTHFQPTQYTSKLSFLSLNDQFLAKGTLSVNHPVTFQGITFYQQGVSYEGIELILHVHSLYDLEELPLSIDLKVGESIVLDPEKTELTLVDFQPVNPNLNDTKTDLSNQAIYRQLTPPEVTDLGPSVLFSLVIPGQSPIQIHQFLEPVHLDNQAYWVSGVFSPEKQSMEYWKIPKLKEISLDDFLRFRQRLSNSQEREMLANAILVPLSPPESLPSLSDEQPQQVISNLLAHFAHNGLESILANLQTISDVHQQQLSRQSIMTVLYRAIQLGLEGGDTLSLNELNDVLLAISAGRDYPSPWFLEPTFWRGKPTSVIEIAHLPGEKWIYAGFVLFLAGLCLKWWKTDRQ